MTALDSNSRLSNRVTSDAPSPGKSRPVLGVIFKISQGPTTLRRFLLGTFVGLATLGILFWADIITGPNIFLGQLYIVIVLLAAWIGGRWSGHLLGPITTAIWFIAFEKQHKVIFTGGIVDSIWNISIRLSLYAGIVEVISLLQNIERRLQHVVAERTTELQSEVVERQRAEASLRKLGAQLSAAEDAERRRVAYDIHDALSQMLGLVKLNLETTVAETAIDTRQYSRLGDAVKMIDDLIRQTRNLTFDLHPAMLDHFGLVPTIQRFAEDFARHTNAEVSINEVGSAASLPIELASYLFRAIKEIVNNSIKHGNAKQIVVTFHWLHEQLRIVADDDGDGFNTQQAMAPQLRRGLGLAGIQERLNSLGGRLRLESQAGSGTRVIMEIPVDRQQA